MEHLVINNIPVEVTDDINDVIRIQASEDDKQKRDDPFFLGDLGHVVNKYKLWKAQLPRVTPFYAMKCNDDPAVLGVLDKLGAGFDCASKGEIEKILDLGVDANRIVYANPCKQTSHVKFAAANQVSMMTFDNENELHKVKANFPDAELIIRIQPPDASKAKIRLGEKYGCDLNTAQKLLKVAKKLRLNVIGTCFHVGSNCTDSSTYTETVAMARYVFDIAEQLGINMNLLDIGGGFPSHCGPGKLLFEEICDVLRPALDSYFPESMGVRIIAEPGRYFVGSAFTVVLKIIGKRPVTGGTEKPVGKSSDVGFVYYINGGRYNALGNNPLIDFTNVKITTLCDHSGEPTYPSCVWGPSLDSLDYITKHTTLPELSYGEWIYIRNVGAYDMSFTNNFNSMPRLRGHYIIERAACDVIPADRQQ